MADTLTVESLRQIITYDKNNGVFVWLVNARNHSNSGKVAGGIDKDGYWRISIDGKYYSAARLAWFYETGEWPMRQVDHRDTNRLNNSFSNLRLATPSQNKANTNKPSNNTSSRKGVVWHKKSGKWQAQIRTNNRLIYLGLFVDINRAHEVYVNEARRLFGEFHNSGQ